MSVIPQLAKDPDRGPTSAPQARYRRAVGEQRARPPRTGRREEKASEMKPLWHPTLQLKEDGGRTSARACLQHLLQRNDDGREFFLLLGYILAWVHSGGRHVKREVPESLRVCWRAGGLCTTPRW